MIIKNILKPKAEEDIIQGLSNLSQKDLNDKLVWASYYGYKKIVQILLLTSVNINIKNNDGWTILMIASRNEHINVVQLLLDNGADVNIKNNHGVTALMYASLNVNKDIYELLKKYGATS